MTKKEADAKAGEAVRLAQALYKEMVEDLDVEKYGFGWWHGYLDARRNALIAEYLVASVAGVRTALESAAFCFETWSKGQFADDMWVRRTLRDLGPNTPDITITSALRRTGIDKEREMRIQLASEHLYYHLAQAFDRLAAVFIGVCALNTDILKADWGIVTNDQKFERATSDRRKAGQPEAGVALQQATRQALLDAVETAGPTDWYAWVDGKRNANAHRAPKIQMLLAHRDSKKEPSRLLCLHERQPRWAMTEELVGNPGRSMDEIWLMRDPVVVHEGCLASTATAISEALTLLTEVWAQRKADSKLLVQPAGQWIYVLEQHQLAFDGYGDQTVKTPDTGVVRLSPDNSRRMEAAGIFDRKFWKAD